MKSKFDAKIQELKMSTEKVSVKLKSGCIIEGKLKWQRDEFGEFPVIHEYIGVDRDGFGTYQKHLITQNNVDIDSFKIIR